MIYDSKYMRRENAEEKALMDAVQESLKRLAVIDGTFAAVSIGTALQFARSAEQRRATVVRALTAQSSDADQENAVRDAGLLSIYFAIDLLIPSMRSEYPELGVFLERIAAEWNDRAEKKKPAVTSGGRGDSHKGGHQ